jgi:phosphinothricin acetyltransferase
MIGFCFLLQYRRKDAYRKTAEMGLYFDERFTNKGFGQVAIAYLENAAKQLGYRMSIASISGENLPSLKLFEKLGYTRCAHYKGIAEKFHRTQDIIDLQKTL